VKRIVKRTNYYDHSLCIFDCYVGCTLLKSPAIGSFGTSMSNTLMHLEHVRVHRLNRAACLVAEVESAFVLPLRLARDTTREAKSFPIGINNLEATQTTICHILKFFITPNIPTRTIIKRLVVVNAQLTTQVFEGRIFFWRFNGFLFHRSKSLVTLNKVLGVNKTARITC